MSKKKKSKKRFTNIAVLFDADNIPASSVKSILSNIEKVGDISVKRAYANWEKSNLQKWPETLKKYGIKAEQVFDFVKGKNASDMMLTIDAIDLLHTNLYDAFAVISSDSDFTPLVTRIRESGAYTIVSGNKQTPEAMQNSSDLFFFYDEPNHLSPEKEDEKICEVLEYATEKYSESNGYTNICVIHSVMQNMLPDFNLQSHGYKKWQELVDAYPDKYETKKCPGKGGTMIVGFKAVA